MTRPMGEGSPPPEFKFEIDEAIAQGQYANLAVITNTQQEFILDFARIVPGRNPRIVARVITSPEHAKALLVSLGQNLERFEAQHGPIREIRGGPHPSGN